MTVVVQTDETTYGSTNFFYDKDVTNGSNNPWSFKRWSKIILKFMVMFIGDSSEW